MPHFDRAVPSADASQLLLQPTQRSMCVQVDWRFPAMAGMTLVRTERFQAIEHRESMRTLAGQIDVAQARR
ncbi:hypothetical protein DIE07_02370 [Burkholderia sp. Bp9002]|nr:hypothetical protein DIE18_00310 [Burkholderia sp. Bp9125]RQS16347.1 hypothetical protein DIE07_02370 [Burkholderia sp. Bp9002]